MISASKDTRARLRPSDSITTARANRASRVPSAGAPSRWPYPARGHESAQAGSGAPVRDLLPNPTRMGLGGVGAFLEQSADPLKGLLTGRGFRIGLGVDPSDARDQGDQSRARESRRDTRRPPFVQERHDAPVWGAPIENQLEKTRRVQARIHSIESQRVCPRKPFPPERRRSGRHRAIGGSDRRSRGSRAGPGARTSHPRASNVPAAFGVRVPLAGAQESL